MSNLAKTWVMRAFFAVIILAFVLVWGVSDFFQGGGQRGDYTVATVGDVKIGMGQFLKQVKITAMRASQSGQPMDESSAQRQVLQNLVTNATLDQEADQLGLAISDAQIAAIIKGAPTFHDKSGEFSKQIFEAVAHAEEMTPKAFEEELRMEARRNQLLQMVTSGLTMPSTYVLPLYKWQHQKRTLDYAVIQPTSFTKLPVPSDAEMKAYYDEHHDEFTRPETRDVTVVLLSEKTILPRIKLTQEEIQTGMAMRRDQTKGALPTKAETERIMNELKTEKSMDEFNRLTTAIEDSMAGGMTLEELAKQHELPIIKIEGMQRSGMSANKTSLSPDALLEAADQGFKQEPGEDPFLSQLNNGEYMAARVDKVHSAKLLPYEEVTKDIVLILNNEAQHNAAKELAETMVKKIDEGGKLATLAKENKLELKTGVATDRLGDGDKGLAAGIRAIAFTTELNKAGIAPAEKASLAVVVPRTIVEPKTEDIKEEDMKVFKTNLERNMANDMLIQYLEALQKRYRVELNKAALEKLQQQQQPK